jgi:hypothetical protein
MEREIQIRREFEKRKMKRAREKERKRYFFVTDT